MKRILVFLVCTLTFMYVYGQQNDHGGTFSNPILKGFYPDPSICRVGEDYYLVNSSFEYFPGVPIFHSKDLVNWQQLDHVLSRPSQLNLDGVRISGGIFAPTIRYNKGVFYMITTLNRPENGGNFFVTATNPAGPWSEPHFLPKEAIGIDPSLFFDDDGKVYYIGQKKPINQQQVTPYRQIWIHELDLKTKSFIGERKIILEEGALHGASNAEGPHIYKKDGYYYLMIAEGGTGDNHAVTIFRSKDIYGPYEGNKKNPILTHRNLGNYYPVTCTGHADLVDTQNGEWWMVLLGVRKYGGLHYNLGRETFLAKVEWQGGWPVINPGEARVLLTQKKPNLPAFKFATENMKDDFTGDSLQYFWNFLRTPRSKFWSLTEKKGFLSLNLRPETIMELVNPSFIGRRQQDTSFFAETRMNFKPKTKNESAGLVVMMNSNAQFRVEKVLDSGKTFLRLTKRSDGKDELVVQKLVEEDDVVLGVKAIGQLYSFYYMLNDKKVNIAENLDGRILSRVNTGGFTGVYVGMYASSNGRSTTNKAFFDWFSYQQIK
ncbi:MAG TPA: glycoside hydrolase family 43 protein [Pelobium sp.]